jgi:hypothetical protein
MKDNKSKVASASISKLHEKMEKGSEAKHGVDLASIVGKLTKMKKEEKAEGEKC